MCTAVSYKTNSHYFGRNLDLEYSYCESVTITPRRFPLVFRHGSTLNSHYAIIGMAYVKNGYPLYYDAANEKGLAAAGLRFPDNAVYNKPIKGRDNIASYEFIPWILSQCADINEAKELIKAINLTDECFCADLSLTPLHWLISDKNASIAVEPMADGLHIYDNPVGVLTNNPPFDKQSFYLNNFLSLTSGAPENRFSSDLDLYLYSRGMGAIGLPGDLSSASRFVRAAFVKENSVCDGSEAQSISQFFHILDSVCQQRGCVRLNKDEYEITVYSSCINTDTGTYFYKTYDNSSVTAVNMHKEDIEGSRLISYPLITETRIQYQN